MLMARLVYDLSLSSCTFAVALVSDSYGPPDRSDIKLHWGLSVTLLRPSL
jgi:hypothetical protein